MINSRRVRNASRTKQLPVAMAMMTAVIIWTLGVPGTPGVQSEVDSSSYALRLSGHRPVARVIAVSGPASVLWAGRSRPLAAGNELAAGEVVVTCARSMVVVETAEGGVYNIFPESRVGFRENRWSWLDQVDRWLGRIKAHIQGVGGPPSYDPLSSPTAVLAVRAAILPFPVRGVARLARPWSEKRN